MAKQCDMCFQYKDSLSPAMDGVKVGVCKACAYKIRAVTGFLEYHGIHLSYQPSLLDNPPDPPKSKKKAPEEVAKL